MMNGHFKDIRIPLYVIDATIAHELAHYAQGFSSPLPRLSRFPHRGGSVDNELDDRGLNWLVQKELNWLNKNWDKFLQSKEVCR
jgi:predicted metal-dependent hydrolase